MTTATQAQATPPVTQIWVLGQAPNGETLHGYVEDNPDGTASQYEEYWQTVPGGGLVQTRQVA